MRMSYNIVLFQGNIWCGVQIALVELSVSPALVAGTRMLPTRSWAANFAKTAINVSNFTAFLSLAACQIHMRDPDCDNPTYGHATETAFVILHVLQAISPRHTIDITLHHMALS